MRLIVALIAVGASLASPALRLHQRSRVAAARARVPLEVSAMRPPSPIRAPTPESYPAAPGAVADPGVEPSDSSAWSARAWRCWPGRSWPDRSARKRPAAGPR